MYHCRRFTIAILLIVLSWFGLTSLHQYLDPNKHGTAEQTEDAKWIATSKNFLDRQACRWIGICGLAHYRPDPAARSWRHKRDIREQKPLSEGEGVSEDSPAWEDIIGEDNKSRPEDWHGDTRVLKEVPQFVLDHAPLIHLYSDEQFWPSNIAEHLYNMIPYVNHTSLNLTERQHGVQNLHEINVGRTATELYLQSKDDVEERPDWLGSAYNKPVPYDDEEEEDEEEVDTYTEFKTAEISVAEVEGKEWFDPYASPTPKSSAPFSSSGPRKQSLLSRRSKYVSRNRKRDPVLLKPGGYSPAPAILVLVDKGNGILDAFWFYFYSYNLGTTVLKVRFGNHIGDWEHSLIRFHHGVPKAVFFSAHSGGLAYSYDSVEKGKGKGRQGRPVLYSAKGSHAMYATPGTHPYILPFGILADVADKGPLWDPALNYLGYHLNTSTTHGADAYARTARYQAEYSNPTVPEMTDTLQPALDNADAPVGWWWYNGHWGDKFYTLGDWRQWRFVGQYHYVNGPYGPRWKNLGRSKVCQSHGKCTILKSLDGDRKRTWLGKRSIDSIEGAIVT